MKLPLILKQSPRQSLKDFKRGLNELTPRDHMESKIVFHFWAMFGATTASISLFLRIFSTESILSRTSSISFSIFILAIAGLQFVEWKKERQKLKSFKDMNKLMKENVEVSNNEKDISVL